MYDPKKVEESLEFCKQIKLYENASDDLFGLPKNPVNPTENAKMNSVSETMVQGIPLKEEASFSETLIRNLMSIVFCIILAVLLSYLITHFVAHHTKVEGNSMYSCLYNNDLLILEKVSYTFHDPERYDIVVFPHNKNVNYIKRIIGLPGETVQVTDGKVLINGQPLDEHYGNEPMQNAGIAQNPIVLGTDEYFVLGDNRNNSSDSRSESVGVIKRSKILGRAWFRFYPFNRMGFLKHQ